MPYHLNVYHNLQLLRKAVRNQERSFYVHNTPQVRSVLAQLQQYGYIGRFLAVHEPYSRLHAKRINKKKRYQRTEVAPYLLVFNKWRQTNKNLPVIGGIEYRHHPVKLKIPYKTSEMGIYRQGMGIEFVQLKDGSFLPSHLCKLRGIDGYHGFKIFS